MGEEINFGYIKLSNPVKTFQFDKKYLTCEDKFIQILINGEDYIRVGDLYHRRILSETLNEFGLKFNVKLNRSGFDIPLYKGENYELVGAGRISSVDDKLKFDDVSADYFENVKGANRNNLERIFSKDNLTESIGVMRLPSFLVSI